MRRYLRTRRAARSASSCARSTPASSPCNSARTRGAAPGARINPETLGRLRELAAEVMRSMPQASPLRVADVLRWPGVIAESPLDEDETRSLAAALCRQALDELVASRSRE